MKHKGDPNKRILDQKQSSPTSFYNLNIRKIPCPLTSISHILTDIHELQCVHGVFGKYRTDLEQLPATINLQIGNNTTRITLTKAVALIHEANPTAVLTPGPCIRFQLEDATDMVV